MNDNVEITRINEINKVYKEQMIELAKDSKNVNNEFLQAMIDNLRIEYNFAVKLVNEETRRLTRLEKRENKLKNKQDNLELRFRLKRMKYSLFRDKKTAKKMFKLFKKQYAFNSKTDIEKARLNVQELVKKTKPKVPLIENKK